MSAFRAEKVVAALPATLEPNTLYSVRVGSGMDLYVTDATGAVAHGLNPPAALAGKQDALGFRITVSATEPISPADGDVWISF